MRRTAPVTLGWASAFLAIVAMMLNSPALFFMTTALIVLLLTAKAQAMLAVRGLRVERHVPEWAVVGEEVRVQVLIASVKNFQRPLVQAQDLLPPRLERNLVQPALAIAPAFGRPIQTEYSFIAARRGVFRWSKVRLSSSDALGLSSATREYETQRTELKILPRLISFDAELSFGVGAGSEEGHHTQSAPFGTGIRSVREYASGDPMRHIHWRSSAKRGALMVKEFESDSSLRADVLIQMQAGSDKVDSDGSLLDDAMGYALHLIQRLLLAGAEVRFGPAEGQKPSGATIEDQVHSIQMAMLPLQANVTQDFETVLRTSRQRYGRLYLFVMRADYSLPKFLKGKEAEVFLLDRTEYGLVDQLDSDAPVKLSRKRKKQAIIEPSFSAADPEFVEALRAVGAHVTLLRRPSA